MSPVKQAGIAPRILPRLYAAKDAPMLGKGLEGLGKYIYESLYDLDPAVQEALYRALGDTNTAHRLGSVVGLAGAGGLGYLVVAPTPPKVPEPNPYATLMASRNAYS